MNKQSETIKFIIERSDKNKRLDLFLSEKLTDYNRSQILKVIKNGGVSLNDKVVSKGGLLLSENDTITFQKVEANYDYLAPKDIPLDIVYEDDDLLVINKQKGLVVHPATGHIDDTLVNALKHYLGNNLSRLSENEYRPGIVHRIDKDTTGLLIVAKNDATHNYLSELLKEHQIQREYYAIIHGIINENNINIDAPIGRDPKTRMKRAVGGLDMKEARTKAQVIYRIQDKYTFLKVQLETGRTHQIRVHFAYLKHPVIGDPVYGFKNDIYAPQGQFLHAYKLSFIHPKTKKLLVVETPIPEYFDQILKE